MRFALSQPFDDEPGGPMLYSTGSTHLLSAILTKSRGKPTLALAREWLGPVKDFRIGAWERDPQGIYLGGNQMAMSTRSLLAFGELYRNGGRTPKGGRSCRPTGSRNPGSHAPIPAFPATATAMAGSCGAGGEDVHFAWGYGGQMLYIVPSLDLTVVMTSEESGPSARNGYRDALHGLLAEIIESARTSCTGRMAKAVFTAIAIRKVSNSQADISTTPQSPASEAKASSLPFLLQLIEVIAPLPGRRISASLLSAMRTARIMPSMKPIARISSAGWNLTCGRHDVGARAEFQRRLAHRAILALERPDDRRRRTGRGKPLALGGPGQRLHLGRIAGHAHVAGLGARLDIEFPAVQRVFLHGGHEKIAIRREGDAGVGAFPFQIDRLRAHANPVQRNAIVARSSDAHALWREGEAFDRALLGEFLGLAVGKADECALRRRHRRSRPAGRRPPAKSICAEHWQSR